MVDEEMQRLNTSTRVPPSGPGICVVDIVELKIGCLLANARMPLIVSSAASCFFLKDV